MPHISLTAVVRTINSHPSGSYREMEEEGEEDLPPRRRSASLSIAATQRRNRHMSKSRLSVVETPKEKGDSWVRRFSIRKKSSVRKGKSVESLNRSTEVCVTMVTINHVPMKWLQYHLSYCYHGYHYT
eukprot:sb/3475349/